MKTEQFTTVKTEISINKCLEYSENPDQLKTLLNEIDVLVKFTGIKKYFDDDKEERLTGVFKIVRGSKSIEFDFGFSVNDTEIFTVKPITYTSNTKYHNKLWHVPAQLAKQLQKDKQEFFDGLLYSCLSSVSSEYNCSIDFDDFCSDFGYNNDSIKAKKTWEACLKQSSKLQRIFNDDDIACLLS